MSPFSIFPERFINSSKSLLKRTALVCAVSNIAHSVGQSYVGTPTSDWDAERNCRCEPPLKTHQSSCGSWVKVPKSR